jgi:predicted ABC-type ATPase
VLFISTENANLNAGRVLVRVSRGGQAAPASSVIDSYRESTKNLSEVRKHADELIVYDNTAHDRGYRVVAHFIGGELSKAAQTIPDWVAKVFGKELHPAKLRAKPGRGR